MKNLTTLAGLSLALWIAGCTQEAQQELSDATGSAEETAAETVSDAAETVSDAADSVEESAGQTVEAAKVVMDDAAEKAGDAKNQIAAGMSGLVEKASEQLKSVEGGEQMLKKVTTYINSAKEALSNVDNTETAQTAAAKLEELEGSLEGVPEKFAALPEGAKSALAGVIEKGREALQQLAQKIDENPEIREVIKPKIEQVMQKLSSLTGDKKK